MFNLVKFVSKRQKHNLILNSWCEPKLEDCSSDVIKKWHGMPVTSTWRLTVDVRHVLTFHHVYSYSQLYNLLFNQFRRHCLINILPKKHVTLCSATCSWCWCTMCSCSSLSWFNFCRNKWQHSSMCCGEKLYEQKKQLFLKKKLLHDMYVDKRKWEMHCGVLAFLNLFSNNNRIIKYCT